MKIRMQTFGLLLAVIIIVMLPGLTTSYAQDGPEASISAANCAVTAFDIAGQGYGYIEGTSGGGLPPGLVRGQIIDPTAAELQVVRTVGTEPVAILVVDDFFEYSDGIAHGRLVTDLLIAMIQANPIYASAPVQLNASAVDEPVIWAWEPAGYGKLLVVEVDTEDYDTSALSTYVEDAVTLVHDDYGVDRVVLNMSFVLVPCKTPEYDLPTLRAGRVPGETQRPVLLSEVARGKDVSIDLERTPGDLANTALGADPGSRVVVDLIAQYAGRAKQRTLGDGGPSVLDPLHEYIRGLTGTGAYWNTTGDLVVFAVGSAGNFGRPLDSFVPGAWTEVASTSALVGLRAPWVSSNKGQVMLPGGVFQLDDDYLIGTSFSAPVLSMNMAFYMTNSTLCADPPLTLNLTDFRDEDMLRIVNTSCSPPFIAARR